MLWAEAELRTIAYIALAAYLWGSIPFGILWARGFGLGNLRRIGSGNIGATNVLRTGNRRAAFLTLISDSGKGGLAVFATTIMVNENMAQIVALATLIGHCYSVFLGFKGGKGVATFLGVLLALSFPLGAIACLTWLLTAAIFRFSSLAALVSALTAPLWVLVLDLTHILALILGLIALLVFQHRTNIARLRIKAEPKIGDGLHKKHT